jgi:hypothetical protein
MPCAFPEGHSLLGGFRRVVTFIGGGPGPGAGAAGGLNLRK